MVGVPPAGAGGHPDEADALACALANILDLVEDVVAVVGEVGRRAPWLADAALFAGDGGGNGVVGGVFDRPCETRGAPCVDAADELVVEFLLGGGPFIVGGGLAIAGEPCVAHFFFVVGGERVVEWIGEDGLRFGGAAGGINGRLLRLGVGVVGVEFDVALRAHEGHAHDDDAGMRTLF